MSVNDFRKCEQTEREFWLNEPNTVIVDGRPFGLDRPVIYNPLMLKILKKQEADTLTEECEKTQEKPEEKLGKNV